MELNLYGVASIQLDKMKGKHIQKLLLTAAACYLTTVLATLFLFPQAIYVRLLEKP